MSLNKLVLLVSLLIGSIASASAAPVCPERPGNSLRTLTVFDGAPEEMASLVPDKGGEKTGYWQLGYVYEAGRVVTIRCKYADDQSSDVVLSKKVSRCDYKYDAKKTLKLNCK